MKWKTLDICLLAAFLLAEITFFILVIIVKIDGSKYFCYSGVALSFLFSLYCIKKKSFNFLITIALGFTLVSDLFLVILEDSVYRPIAMTIFLLAQLTYGLYLDLQFKNIDLSLLIRGRICLSAIGILVVCLVLRSSADYLSIISFIYFINLITNLVMASIKAKQNILLLIGLILFVFCDITTGLSIGEGVYFHFEETSLIYKYIHANINLIWLYYFPSQTLIALSCLFNKAVHYKSEFILTDE